MICYQDFSYRMSAIVEVAGHVGPRRIGRLKRVQQKAFQTIPWKCSVLCCLCPLLLRSWSPLQGKRKALIQTHRYLGVCARMDEHFGGSNGRYYETVSLFSPSSEANEISRQRQLLTSTPPCQWVKIEIFLGERCLYKSLT